MNHWYLHLSVPLHIIMDVFVVVLSSRIFLRELLLLLSGSLGSCWFMIPTHIWPVTWVQADSDTVLDPLDTEVFVGK